MADERILPDVQREAEVRMNADPFFAYITVINYRKGDVSQEVAAALAGLAPKNGRAGACVVILQPIANSANRNVRFAPFEAQWSFLVLEYPLFNDNPDTGTGARAEAICRRLLDLFGLFHPVAITTPFVAQEPFMVPTRIPIPTGIEGEDLLPIAYECRFQCKESRGRSLSQPALPSITVAASGVTITCDTSAVDIYYTLDGSPPAPPHINPSGIAYAGAFTPPSTCIIRAGAWRQQTGSDWTPSDIAWAEWTTLLADEVRTPLGTEEQGFIAT